MRKKLITKGSYLIQRFPGKGGWSYVVIPQAKMSSKNPFGWLKVSGRIDDYDLMNYKLMPMGDGQLFLPVKKAIRKKLMKEAGDIVTVELYEDNSPLTISKELFDCFSLEPPETLENFNAMAEGERKAYLDWIYSAKTEETKTMRIAKMMQRVILKKTLKD